MNFTKTLLAAAALTASVGANAVVTGSLGGGFGPFLSLNTTVVDAKCVPAGPATCTLGAPIATINGGTIYASDKPFADIPAGGVFGSRFLASGPTSGDPSTLTFTSGQSYVSFLWGSPDAYNSLRVTDVNGTYSFTASSLGFAKTNGDQSFSQYVQFMGSGITSLVFTNSSAIDAFEVANFSVTPIPEPETYALMLAGLAALGFVSKRRKQA